MLKSEGYFYNMTYTILIDQQFALDNDLSLVQVSTLAAFMTLPMWSEAIAIDGKVWYRYSDTKMSEDFPLLFSVPKRCYKNISELAAQGIVELIKVGNNRYIHFTARCASWNRKDQNWTSGPKTDQEKSENGLNGGPKTDPNYIINIDNHIINNNDSASCGGTGLFPGYEAERIENPVNAETEKKEKSCAKKERKGISENLCLFANSRYAEYEAFKACFDKPEYADVDICYYYNAVADWSAQRAKKKNDWIATARNFMRSDANAGKLHKLSNRGMETDKEYTDRMMDECMRRTLEGWM